jgi:hypothetical protein
MVAGAVCSAILAADVDSLAVHPLPEVVVPLDAAGRRLRRQEQRKNAECGMRNAE